MYDGLTGRYTFPCPASGEVRVRLSSFRTLERLLGPAHPVVFRVTFSCVCGEDHEGLVSHDELDWAPLTAPEAAFFDFMTSRFESVAAELFDRAVRRIRAGEWPWSFFCYPEDRPRPAFPSDFRMVAPGDEGVGVVVRCPGCSRTSVNLVTCNHVDVPFYNDERIAVVEHIFVSDEVATLDAFREELGSSSFDARARRLTA